MNISFCSASSFITQFQTVIMDEMDSIFNGSDRLATIHDLNEMKYLERVIKEALRLYPSVGFISRCLSEDIIMGE